MRSNFEEDMGCSGSPRLDAYRYFTEGAIGTILHIFSIESRNLEPTSHGAACLLYPKVAHGTFQPRLSTETLSNLFRPPAFGCQSNRRAVAGTCLCNSLSCCLKVQNRHRAEALALRSTAKASELVINLGIASHF